MLCCLVILCFTGWLIGRGMLELIFVLQMMAETRRPVVLVRDGEARIKGGRSRFVARPSNF